MCTHLIPFQSICLFAPNITKLNHSQFVNSLILNSIKTHHVIILLNIIRTQYQWVIFTAFAISIRCERAARMFLNHSLNCTQLPRDGKKLRDSDKVFDLKAFYTFTVDDSLLSLRIQQSAFISLINSWMNCSFQTRNLMTDSKLETLEYNQEISPADFCIATTVLTIIFVIVAIVL